MPPMDTSSGTGILEIQREFVTVDGIQVGYLLTGSGPPLLLVHGFGEFIETWAYNIDALSKHFTVCAFDLPGHGLSQQPPEDYTLDFSMGIVTSFMTALGIRRASLIGRSMGGPLCFCLAADYPDRADRLVLVSSGGFSDRVPLPYRLAMLPILGDLFLGPSVLVSDTTVKLAMRRQFHNPDSIPEEWVHTATRYFKMPHRNAMVRNVVRSNTSLTSSKPKTGVFGRLPLVKAPTLIVHGLQDGLVPAQQAKEAAGILPGAELMLLDECGHNPQIEKAPDFNESVLAFLRRDT